MYAPPNVVGNGDGGVPASYPQFVDGAGGGGGGDDTPLLVAPPSQPQQQQQQQQPRALFPTFTFSPNNLNLLNTSRLSAILNVITLIGHAAIIVLLAWALLKLYDVRCDCGGGGEAVSASHATPASSSAALLSSSSSGTSWAISSGGGRILAALSCEGSALCEYTIATTSEQYTCATFQHDQDDDADHNNGAANVNALLTADAVVLLGDSFVGGAGSTSYSATSWVGRLMTRIRSANNDRDVKAFNGAIGQAADQQDLNTQVTTLLSTDNDFARSIHADTSKRVVVIVSTSGLAPSTLQQQLVTAVYGRLLGSRPSNAARVFLMVSPDPYWGTVAVGTDLAEITSSCAAVTTSDKQTRTALRAVYYQVAMRYSATTVVVDVDMALGRFAFGGPVVMQSAEEKQLRDLSSSSSSSMASAIEDKSALLTLCSAPSVANSLRTAYLSDRGHLALTDVLWNCASNVPYSVPSELAD